MLQATVNHFVFCFCELGILPRTAVDQQCEEKIRGIVKLHFPSHAFLGEETAGLNWPSWLHLGFGTVHSMIVTLAS